MGGHPDPLSDWKEALSGWAIPDEIVARAPEPPWFFPTASFGQRADRQVEARLGPSLARAEEALGEGGTVLDVGAGGGAASLPLAGRATALTAVDSQQDMLDDLAARAAWLGVLATTVCGSWPEAAAEVEAADVVLCHHVLYNAPDLGPFVRALHDHARRRVVVEMTERHPLAPMNPLWLRFHGLVRPEGPTAHDAVACLRALGFDARSEAWQAPPESFFASFEDQVAQVRRRLCLPAARDSEVAAALIEMGAGSESPAGLGQPRTLVTIWWDT